MPTTAMKGAEPWGTFYRQGGGNAYPDESLVRLILGRYLDLPQSGRVLDVGFGRGANLVMLARAGFEAHGVEVSQECLETARQLAAQAGVDLKLARLTGSELPYPDEHFDLVVSWNTLYFAGTRSLVSQALGEYHRVLRRGGTLLLSVIHPKSSMVRRLSKDLGDGARRVAPWTPAGQRGTYRSPYNHQNGMTLFYEPTAQGWRRLLAAFDEVREGLFEADLFAPGRHIASRLWLARKGAAAR